MFVVSGVAEQFERGNPKYVVGKSGIDLAHEVYEKATNGVYYWETCKRPQEKSREYWAGWALAHYQWYSATSPCAFVRGLSICKNKN